MDFTKEEIAQVACNIYNSASTMFLGNVKVYLVGHNMPGYMPDDPPYALPTAGEAIDALVEELTTHAYDCEGTAEEAEALDAINSTKPLDRNELRQDVTFHVGNHVYWIHVLPASEVINL